MFIRLRKNESKNNFSPEVCIYIRYDAGWDCRSRHRNLRQVTIHAFTHFEEIR
jgi:hypothetical protein